MPAVRGATNNVFKIFVLLVMDREEPSWLDHARKLFKIPKRIIKLIHSWNLNIFWIITPKHVQMELMHKEFMVASAFHCSLFDFNFNPRFANLIKFHDFALAIAENNFRFVEIIIWQFIIPDFVSFIFNINYFVSQIYFISFINEKRNYGFLVKEYFDNSTMRETRIFFSHFISI